MKRIKVMGLCLVALFALTAAAASSASAASPEYKVCAKAAVKEGGTFTDKNCTIPAKGKEKNAKYELAGIEHAKKPALKGTNGASNLYVFITGVGVVGETSCTKAKDTGAFTGPKTTKTVAKFEHCSSSKKVCTSPGAKAGVIETFGLKGELFATGQSATGVAVQITGEGAGGKSAEFNCEGEEISTTGAVSAELTEAAGKISKTSKNIFAVNSPALGEPTITSPAGPLLTTIVGVGTVESGEETTASLKGEAAGAF
jgi:hypothetical protein